jgi:hypothetical protein
MSNETPVARYGYKEEPKGNIINLLNGYSGGGMGEKIECAPGMTLGDLVEEHLKGIPATNYLIRLNSKDPSGPDVQLQNNDVVRITPLKVEGGGE